MDERAPLTWAPPTTKAEGAESMTPRPPAAMYAQQNRDRHMTMSIGAAYCSTVLMLSIPSRDGLHSFIGWCTRG